MTDRDLAALCAHLRVAYCTETVNGLTHGWWECSSECGMKFVPSGAYDQLRAERDAHVIARGHTETERNEALREREQARAELQLYRKGTTDDSTHSALRRLLEQLTQRAEKAEQELRDQDMKWLERLNRADSATQKAEREAANAETARRIDTTALQTLLHVAEQQRDRLASVLRAIIGSGASFDEPRLGYIEMQIDRGDLGEARVALAELEKKP